MMPTRTSSSASARFSSRSSFPLRRRDRTRMTYGTSGRSSIWGLSSIGFPFGLFGTSKLEMAYSRLMGRFIFMVFCLSVIFMLYQYMTPHNTFWTIGFAFVGAIVMAGHMISWVTGCLTGSDKDDESKSSGEQDTITSDLLQRLLDRH
ncbi:hypothetical protein SORBI_3002G048001 [Sorghum bicolor]|uniref:Uncharacterized protein n=1 Tax=Sorghum bicolor TaxID=4558 RepID=A0A1W0W2B5_SORBI|nr:hypothetical protein SORBI_3002G048001 [Sorghum bicolor]OQU88513.1 hypothetical protein SORBI_3002G048001 [Sorghum bicolor]